MSRLMLFALSALLVSGCSTTPSPAVTLERPPLPASLLVRCPDLQPLSDQSFQAVTVKLVEVAALYRQCQTRHAGLSELAMELR